MPRLLLLLIALVLTLQSAVAAASGLTDALDHLAHPWHHSHDRGQGDGDDHDEPLALDDDDHPQQGADHQHSHSHPVFAPILPVGIALNHPAAVASPPTSPTKAMISVPPGRLERPPRHIPVA